MVDKKRGTSLRGGRKADEAIPNLRLLRLRLEHCLAMTIAAFSIYLAGALPLHASDLPPSTDMSVQHQQVDEEAHDELLQFESRQPQGYDELIKDETAEDDSEKLIRFLSVRP